MDTDDICDILMQAIEYYKENADEFIPAGKYNVSFSIVVNDRNHTVLVKDVDIHQE